MMEGLSIILPIMMAAGFLGAAASTALNKDERSWEAFKWNCIIGVSASFLIPVFLTTVSSEVLHSLTIQSPSPTLDKYLVFAGYCLLGAISAQRVITTLSDKVFQIAKDAKKTAQEAKAESKETKASAEKAEKVALESKASAEQTKMVALAASDAIRYGIKEEPPATPSIAAAKHFDETSLGQALKSDDPWKDKFGGKPETNGRKLQAEITRMIERPDSAAICLKVSSTDAKRSLLGTVSFFLHPSFENYNPVVPVVNGEAVLNITSWGAFTVGAVCDDGTTKLELDLSEHPDAWEPWKSR